VKSVKIYNLQGALMKIETNKTELDLTDMSKGLYLFEIATSNGRYVYKIIKE